MLVCGEMVLDVSCFEISWVKVMVDMFSVEIGNVWVIDFFKSLVMFNVF